ncbi:uncharacterized protein [Rutidosis leptorrhynchoides]|uniref:uncharacterized protein n=1 Tax=Rutidosis leptorrhynchoides TaxID=125765 RepID=UPI003A9A2AB3
MGNGIDSWKWALSSNGIFTTKKLQGLIEEKFLTEGRGNRETLRNFLVPKKVEIFIWRVLNKRITVLTELDKRGIDLHSVRCPICDDDIETIEHSLVFCKHAFDVWARVYKWWGLDSFSNLSTSETFLGSINATSSGLGSKIWQAVDWTSGYILWKNRNNKVYKNKSSCGPSVLSEIQVISFDWISRRLKGKQLDWHIWLVNPHSFLTLS